MKNEKNYKELLVKLNSLIDKLYFEAETKDELAVILGDIEREAEEVYWDYEEEIPEDDDYIENEPDTLENLGFRMSDFI